MSCPQPSSPTCIPVPPAPEMNSKKPLETLDSHRSIDLFAARRGGTPALSLSVATGGRWGGGDGGLAYGLVRRHMGEESLRDVHEVTGRGKAGVAKSSDTTRQLTLLAGERAD